MKWFSLKGIVQEAKKVRWPRRNEIAKDSFTSIVFILIFAAFFVLSDLLITIALTAIGVLK